MTIAVFAFTVQPDQMAGVLIAVMAFPFQLPPIVGAGRTGKGYTDHHR